MNWYRQIKLSQTNPPKPGNWFDVGHKGFRGDSEGCQEWMWAWEDGGLQVEDTTDEEGLMHCDIYMGAFQTWRGRADRCPKWGYTRISFCGPEADGLLAQKAPSSLERSLYRYFGEDAQIYYFDGSQ